MPILGIVSSGANVAGGAFESIASTTLSSDVSSYTFSNIPQTYEHLQVRMLVKTAPTSFSDWYRLQVKGSSVSESSYDVDANGATVGQSFNTSSITSAFAPTNSSSLANYFGVAVVNIFDYAKTDKAKTWHSLFGFDANTVINPRLGFSQTIDTSTSAITSLEISQPTAGADLAAGTKLALYGIKGK